jgi:hypothetical protein
MAPSADNPPKLDNWTGPFVLGLANTLSKSFSGPSTQSPNYYSHSLANTTIVVTKHKL